MFPALLETLPSDGAVKRHLDGKEQDATLRLRPEPAAEVSEEQEQANDPATNWGAW